MGGVLGHKGRAVRVFFGNVSAESRYGFAAKSLRVAFHSAILCACVCESMIPKMFYLFKKVPNPYVELSLGIKFLISAQ